MQKPGVIVRRSFRDTWIVTTAVLTVLASVAPSRATDWDDSGGVNSNDISAFLTSWLQSIAGGTLDADFKGDLTVDSNDISAFLTAWIRDVNNGC
jgi:hypothetical protein